MALTPNDIAQLAYNAGFRGSALRMAVAIALAESNGNPNAYNPEVAAGTRPGHGSRGLWQIYGTAHPEYDNEQTFNPVTNAQAAFKVYTEAGNRFTPWSTFNNGSANKISQNLNVDLPTSQIDVTGGGGAGALAGTVASVIAPAFAPSILAAQSTETALQNGGFRISILPAPVEEALSNIARDPQGVKKSIAFGLIGGLLLIIGLIMLVNQMTPQGVKDLAGESVKVAATGGAAKLL